MRARGIVAVALGLLFVVGSPLQAQELTPEESKGGKEITNANSGPDQGGMQQPGEAQSPDDIIEQMTGGSEAAAGTERNPALLEGGEFEAGRDIFEGIFNKSPTESGPMEEGLPGMRIEEVQLSGIMTGAFGTVALFLGKDKELYPARQNQKFANGRLQQISNDKVVFEQEVIDEFGKKRPPIVKEVQLHTEKKKGRGR